MRSITTLDISQAFPLQEDPKQTNIPPMSFQASEPKKMNSQDINHYEWGQCLKWLKAELEFSTAYLFIAVQHLGDFAIDVLTSNFLW